MGKKIVLTINDQGKVGKSTSTKKIASALRQMGIPFSLFDADNDHKSIFNTYATKKKNGEFEEKQNAQTGCVQINIDLQADAILNAMVEPTDIILIDGPARGIQATFNALGKGKSQSFVDTFADNDATLYLYVPWTDDHKDKKSSSSIDKIYSCLENVDFDDYDPDFKIHIIIGFDKFFMTDEQSCMAHYQSNISIKAMMNDPRFEIHFIEMDAELTKSVLEDVAEVSFDVALEKTVWPANKTVIRGAIRDGKKVVKILTQE